jgi:hypothetical protein
MASKKDISQVSGERLEPDTRVIACEVFRDELAYLGIDPSSCLFLKQGLHRHPKELNTRLANSIGRIERDFSPKKLILVYGYCGGGLENISSASADLVFARVHDCIHLFLSRNPTRIDAEGNGIYFLSRGWIRYGRTPYSDYLSLKDKLGHEEAFRACKRLFKAYGRVIYVNSVPHNSSLMRSKSEEFARFFGMQHSEMQADLSLLKNLLGGRTSRRILQVKPRNKVTKKQFR